MSGQPDRVERVEPNADQRAAAQQSFELYAAFRQAGFKDVEALHLIGVMLATAITNPQGDT